MVGIIVTTCGNLALNFIETVEMVLGKQEFVETVGIIPQDSADDISFNLKIAIEKLQNASFVPDVGAQGRTPTRAKLRQKLSGVLILSGIYGESCCNFSLSLCRRSNITSSCPLRVVTGVNLPMLFKVFTYRKVLSLDELAARACEGGQEGIFDATERLEILD